MAAGDPDMAILLALAALPDDTIDTSDIPEVLDWSGAKRGLLYRPSSSNLRFAWTPT